MHRTHAEYDRNAIKWIWLWSLKIDIFLLEKPLKNISVTTHENALCIETLRTGLPCAQFLASTIKCQIKKTVISNQFVPSSLPLGRGLVIGNHFVPSPHSLGRCLMIGNHFVPSPLPLGRCVMITSHSMEECEALCTRLAIMVNGKFRCLGSPQHLKNKFVQGFTLLVNPPSDTPSNDTTLVKEFVAETFPGSELRDEHNGLLNYHIGDSKWAWSSLFAILEDAHSRSVIGNYAVTQTTLEQIFLNFARSQRGHDE